MMDHETVMHSQEHPIQQTVTTFSASWLSSNCVTHPNKEHFFNWFHVSRGPSQRDPSI